MSKLLPLFLVLFFRSVDSTEELEITGFGWHSPQLIFTSRYFFIWNKSVDSVVITSPDKSCRLWQQVFNQTDFGDRLLTIVRYKLLSDVCLGGLQISLFGDNNQLLAKKVIEEDIWSENCICRRQDWSLLMGCHKMSQQFQQIDEDLRFESDFEFIFN